MFQTKGTNLYIRCHVTLLTYNVERRRQMDARINIFE